MISQSRLKIILSQLEGFKKSKKSLEQYITPPEVAAEVIHKAAVSGDISGKNVVDLGCGTGILSIGAALENGKVEGIELDKTAVKIAKNNLKKAEKASKQELKVKFETRDIREIEKNSDTVLMNPPFGIGSRKNKNLLFLEKACQTGQVIYAILHSSEKEKEKTRQFIKKFLHKHSAEVKGIKNLAFQVTQQGSRKKVSTDLYKIVINNGAQNKREGRKS